MADLSRSLHRNQASSATLSKKLSSVHSFTGKSMYDDVFTTPTKFGAPTFSSRVEDYSEIFGSAHSSRPTSVPVLELPAVDKREVSVDVRSSKFDYSKIFGGFGDVEFAASYEELIAKPKDADVSSEEVWTPVESGSTSEESDLSKCPEENQVNSHEASYQSFDGMKQFNMSYHRTKDGANGTTHIAQLHAVSGFTCLIDEVTPLQKTVGNKPVPSINDVSPTIDIGEGIIEGKHCRKVTSHLPNCGANGKTFEEDVKFQSGGDWNGSNLNDTLPHANEMGLKADSSKVVRTSSPAPNLGNGNSASKRRMASKSKASKRNAFEGVAGDCSPTYSDEEVYANSATAASAAAVKKAIEEAQARIRIAKESMERKKEGIQSRVKQSFKDGLKVKERREVKIADEADRVKEKKAWEIREKENTAMQDPSGEERQNAMRTGQEDPNFKDWKKRYFTKEALGETNGKECDSTPVNHRCEDGEWEAAKESGKFVNTGEYMEATLAFKQEDGRKKMVQSIDEYEWMEWKSTEETFGVPELNDEKFTAVEEALEQEEFEKKLNVVNGEQEWEERANKLKSAEDIHEPEESDIKLRVAREQEGIEEKLTASHEQEGCEKKLNEFREPIENERKLETLEWEENDKKRLKEAQKQLEFEMEQKEAHEQEENEKRLKEVCEREENAKRIKEVREREENEKRLKELYEQQEFEKRLKQACEWVEYEKKPKDFCGGEENEKKQKDAHAGEDCEKGSDKVYEQKIGLDDPHEREEREKRLKKDFEWLGDEKLEEAQKQEENDNILKEAYQMEGNERKGKQANEWEDSETIQGETHWREENEKKIKATKEVLRCEEKTHQATYDACKQGESEGLSWTQEASSHKENDNDVEVTQEVLTREGNRMMVKVTKASCEPEENEEELKAVKVSIELEEKEMLGTAYWVKGALEHNRIENSMKDESEAFLFDDSGVNEPKENEEEPRTVNLENELKDEEIFETACLTKDVFEHNEIMSHMRDECEALLSDEVWVNLDETNMNAGQKQTDLNKKESRSACNLGKHAEKLANELGGNSKNLKEAEFVFDQVEEKNNLKAAHGEEQWVQNGKKMEASQLNSVFDGKGKTLEIPQETKINQSTEQIKENLDETLTMEKREAEETMQKEAVLEKENFRNTDKAKERERERERESEMERERERDRIAVERAIREARERAFAEARERAERAAVERATAEARQRVLAGARERSEKASAEVKDKSIAEKVSMEAKLKAERAAVERATAEARERALEKALAEKAAFVAEKFSGSSSDNGMRRSFSSSDPQYQGSGPSSSSSYSNSSNYGATEGFDDGAGSESTQRCKARLEKHQQIVERAAKALAEKNKRDLLAQKEQAERNRLAEALDADVKRWSSGKAGNLRALLLTLQYILGPSSGWQPIPLTDIVTNNAVKKAYRKATLFVHPDKLQQRGASIQQKYICEKVFDLLKEAWNKFNSEER